MKIKEQFCKKLYDELENYKRAGQPQITSCFDCGKMDIFLNIYNILISSADDFSDALLMNLVNQSTGILESVYKEFESQSDTEDFYSNIKSHVEKNAEYSVFDEEMDEEDYAWWNNSTYDEGGF